MHMSRNERKEQDATLRLKLEKMWDLLDKAPLLAKLHEAGIQVTMKDLQFFSSQNNALLSVAMDHNCSHESTKEFNEIAKAFVAYDRGPQMADKAGLHSIASFKQRFSKFGIPLMKYKICDCAMHIFDTKVCDHCDDSGTLQCPHCETLETELEKGWVWHEFSLVHILQDLFEDPVTSAMMQAWYHFVTNNPRTEGLVRCLWESPRFDKKRDTYPEFFQDPRNVIIFMTADAYVVTKNGSKNSFPILFQVINFPPHLRAKYDYLQWFGICDGKPKARVLYDRFVDQLKPLWTMGCRVWDYQSKAFFTCRIMLYGILMDLKGLLEAMEKMDVGAFRACPVCNIWGTLCSCLHMMTYRTDMHVEKWGSEPTLWYKELVELIFEGNEDKVTSLLQARPNLKRAGALNNINVKELFKAVGWKLTAVFVRLSYFDISEDCRLDTMHSFQNLGRRLNVCVMGDDMNVAMREQARLLKQRKTWWLGNEDFINPFAIPSMQLRTGGK